MRRLGFLLVSLLLVFGACARSGKSSSPSEIVEPDVVPPSGQPWSIVDHCRRGESARPAVLEIVFSGEEGPFDAEEYSGWSYEPIRSAFQNAGLPTDVVDRQRRQLDGKRQSAIAVPGTVRELVPAGRRLGRARPPTKQQYAPDVSITCAGLRSLNGSLSITLPKDVQVNDVLRAQGQKESVDGEPSDFDFTQHVIYPLKTSQPRFVVERAIDYLRDDRVWLAEVGLNCAHVPENPAPAGCDISVEPPNRTPSPEAKYGCPADDQSTTCKRVRATATSKPRAQPAYPGSVVLATDTQCCIFYIEDDPGSECSTYQTVMATKDEHTKVVDFYLGRGFSVRPSETEGHWTAIAGEGDMKAMRKVIVREPEPDEGNWRTAIELYSPNCSAKPYRD